MESLPTVKALHFGCHAAGYYKVKQVKGEGHAATRSEPAPLPESYIHAI